MALVQNRPEAHRTSDLAISQVSEMLHSHGWVVNKIATDYGEDLEVQVVQNARITSSRFYIQCKGTREIGKRTKGDRIRYSGLKRGTVRRWFLSNEIIVLLVWDVEKRYGVYGIVNSLFTPTELLGSARSITATIPSASTVSTNHFGQFEFSILQAFMNMTQDKIRRILNQLTRIRRTKGTNSKAGPLKIELGLRRFDLLNQLGVVEGTLHRIEFAPDFEKLVDEWLETISQIERPISYTGTYLAFRASIVAWVRNRFNSEIDRFLLDSALDALYFVNDVSTRWKWAND
jgi:CRISPR/Cas system CSM-associated protein Csm2 small subunit